MLSALVLILTKPMSGVDEVVLSLYAKGLTTGEFSAQRAEIYGGCWHRSLTAA